MLAELHGKLDPTSADPIERSEDTLTDAVFGAIRHLPRVEVLGEVLAAAGVEPPLPKVLAGADVRLWPGIPMPRWQRVIEPDVIVVAGKQLVVFEAKLHSAFGMYPSDDGGDPYHQLAVQYAAVSEWAAGEGFDPPVVVAVTAGVQRPDHDLERAVADLQRLLPDVDVPSHSIRWVSWRSIAAALDSVDRVRLHERTLIADALALMEKRGVRRMFTGFQPEDYWLVAAAQRVAGERLYPQLRTFFEDLTAALAENGVGVSQPAYKAVWVGLGTSLAKPTDWTRSFIGAQFWPKAWPTRGKVGANLALYAAFDFLDPALETGLSIPGPGVAAAQKTWAAHLDGVAESIAALPTEYEAVFDAGDISRPSKAIAVEQMDAAWLGSVASQAIGTAHLRLRSRVDPLNLTVQQVRDQIGALTNVIANCGPLWNMLRASGHVSPSNGAGELALDDAATSG